MFAKYFADNYVIRLIRPVNPKSTLNKVELSAFSLTKVIVKLLKATTLRVGTMTWHVPQHIEREEIQAGSARGRRGANAAAALQTL
jgi:hypothetical protein